MAQTFYRRKTLSGALTLAGRLDPKTKVFIRGSGVTRSNKYEVTDDLQYAAISGQGFPSYFKLDTAKKRIQERDKQLFFPHAEFYDVVIVNG